MNKFSVNFSALVELLFSKFFSARALALIHACSVVCLQNPGLI